VDVAWGLTSDAVSGHDTGDYSDPTTAVNQLGCLFTRTSSSPLTTSTRLYIERAVHLASSAKCKLCFLQAVNRSMNNVSSPFHRQIVLFSCVAHFSHVQKIPPDRASTSILFGSGHRGRGPPPVLRRWENQRMLTSWYCRHKNIGNIEEIWLKHIKLDGCTVWIVCNTVVGSKLSAICATVELSSNVFFKLNDLHFSTSVPATWKRCRYAVPARTVRKKASE